MAARHTRVVGNARHVWHSENLWRASADLTPFDLPLSEIAELDMDCWFGDSLPTLREVAHHAKRIQSARMEFPVILAEDGSLMDGGHRVCRALLDGNQAVRAVRFPATPPPDEIVPLG